MTTSYPWETILSHMTPTEWEWSHTGGGCMALVATLPDGRYLMVTDEGLTDDISPTEPVTLGIYPCYDTDEEGTYHPFANMGELLADLANHLD